MNDRIVTDSVGGAARTHAFDFYSAGNRLFGYYQPPRGGPVRSSGVLICHPAGHEYIRCYRALKQLAMQLTVAGFSVMRFDYRGCGDSQGEHLQVSLQDWLSDIDAGLQQLKLLSGFDDISVIGLRLGATLAARYANQYHPVHKIILWDPLVRGESWLEQLRPQHVTHLERFGCPEQNIPDCDREEYEQIMGFEYSRYLLDEIRQIDMVSDISRRIAARILLVDTIQDQSQVTLKQCLGTFHDRIDCIQSSDSKVWLAEPFEAVVPREAITAIVQWMGGG